MSPDLRIEPATLEDLPALAELLEDLFTKEVDFRPDRPKQLRGLRLILEQPNRGRIFVLRGGSRIIGMINLLFTISTAEGGFVVILEDLIIDAGFRGQGFGSRLLDHALNYCRERGFLRVTLLTDREDEASIRFYKRHGFYVADMAPLRFLLPGPDESPVPGPET